MATRTFSLEEQRGLVDFLNSKLKLDINPSNEEIFEQIKPGIVLCQLIDAIEPGHIIRKTNLTPKNAWDKNLNHEIMLEAAKKIGCNVVNIGPQDLTDGTKHLVLGVFWQVVRFGLLKMVKELSESLNLDLDPALPPEQVLLMWLNYHLKKANVPRTVTNFGEDLKDGVVLTHVLNQVAAAQCDLTGLDLPDPRARANKILDDSDKLGCRKYESIQWFITADDLVKGNARLNLAYVAGLFSKFPEMGGGKADQLMDENERLKRQLEALHQAQLASDQNWSSEKEALSSSHADLLEQYNQLLAAYDALKKTNEGYQDTLENLNAHQATLQATIDDLVGRTGKLQQENLDAQNENDNLRGNFEDLQAANEDLKRRIFQLEDEMEELRAANKACEEGRAAQAEQEAADKAQLLAEIEALRQQVADTEAKAAQREQDLLNEIANVRGELNATTANLQGTQLQLASSRNDAASLQQQLNQAIQKIKDGEQAFSLQKSELLRQQKEKDDFFATHATISNDDLERLKKDLILAQETVEQLRAEIASNMSLLETTMKEGWLVKKSPNESFGQKFQKRWFVLKGGSLLYYKTPQDNMSKPTGSIFIENAQVIPLGEKESMEKADKSKWGFEIREVEKKAGTGGKEKKKGDEERIYVLVAASNEDREKWVEALNKCRDQIKGRDTKKAQMSSSVL